MEKLQVGFLGGTFDPIHIGHLQLALDAKEHFGLDQVLFCPTSLSPFKTKNLPFASAQDRFEMVSLAVKDIEGFEVTDLEVKTPGPYYTIDTIKTLKDLHPNWNIHLILGEDHVYSFFEWKEVEELLRLVELKIGSRLGGDIGLDLPFPISSHNFFKIHNLEISSTYLRERMALKRYCQHLLPVKVVDYITKHELYLPL